MENIKIKKKIFVRRVKKDDWKYFRKWWQDTDLITLTSGDFTKYSDEQLYKWFLNMLIDKKSMNFIVLNEQKIVIGHFVLEIKKNIAEYHVVIGNKKYIGQGYGTLINKKAIDIGFKKYKLNRIFLKVRPENLRAKKSYEKVGFKKIAQRKYKNPNRPELIIMEIKK